MALAFITDMANFIPPAGTIGDSVDWTRYPESVPFDFKGQPVFNDVTDVTKSGFGLFIKNQSLMRRTEDGGPSWIGSFDRNARQALLYTNSQPGPLQITFKAPVRGVALQLNVKDPVAHFKMGISAFSGAVKLPVPKSGTRTDGVFSNAGDGSAPCLGIIENNPNRPAITRIVLSLTVLDAGYSGDSSFAINTLKLAI